MNYTASWFYIITGVYASVRSMIYQTCSAFSIAGLSRNSTWETKLSLRTLLHCTFQPKLHNLETINEQCCILYTDFVSDEELANRLPQGCEVHWTRSYHSMPSESEGMQTPSSCKMTDRNLHLISAAITKAKTQDQVYRGFKCLCGELKICDVRVLVPGLESHHVDVVDL